MMLLPSDKATEAELLFTAQSLLAPIFHFVCPLIVSYVHFLSVLSKKIVISETGNDVLLETFGL